MKNLRCKIEILRRRMYEIAIEKGMSHPEVLIASQRLDEAINKLYNVDLIKKAG